MGIPGRDWRRVLDVNLLGTFHCCRTIVPIMRRQQYGRIVMMSSVAGKDGNPNASAYSAAKAAIIALTKSLGKELASLNIAVNCVTPAAARTRIFEQMTDAHIAFMLSKIPRGRFLEVTELASLVAWLASDENSFSTGAVWDLQRGSVDVLVGGSAQLAQLPSCQLPAARCPLPASSFQLPAPLPAPPAARSSFPRPASSFPRPAASYQLPASSCRLPATRFQLPASSFQLRPC